MVTSLKIKAYSLLPAPIRNAYAAYRRPTRQAEALQRLSASLPNWSRRAVDVDAEPPVRLGFVGAGVYAQHHLQAFSSLPGVKLTALLTTGGPRAQEAVRRYGIAHSYVDREAFLQHEGLDAFVVVVPAHLIRAVSQDVLSAGKPVLLEKPAGFSAQETADLATQAQRHQTWGMVCMNRRFYSVVEHGLAALAAEGPIRGAILEIPEDITRDRLSGRLTETEYEHFMFRNSVHGIDLLRYIMGDVVAVHSVSRPNSAFQNAAASYAACLEHEGGLFSTVLALWDTTRTWRLRIIAERGWVELAPFERGWFVSTSRPDIRIPLSPDEVDIEFRPGVYAQDAHFVRAVRNRETPFLPASLLDDAVLTNRLIEAIYCETNEN